VDRVTGGFDRARMSIDASQAVREAITAAKRPLAEVAVDRLSSVDADDSLWRQLADATVADHTTAERGLVRLGRLSVDEVASASLLAEWAKLADPPAAGTRWSTLTPADPVDFLKTELSFESVDYYRAGDVLMRNSGSDCITAQSGWTWPDRQLLFDFTLTARPMTADPAELATCLLCWDTGNAGPDFSSRPPSFTGGEQREHITVTTAGTTARVWHEGRFDLRFLRCDITVL
jgi:hypothetical protein